MVTSDLSMHVKVTLTYVDVLLPTAAAYMSQGTSMQYVLAMAFGPGIAHMHKLF